MQMFIWFLIWLASSSSRKTWTNRQFHSIFACLYICNTETVHIQENHTDYHLWGFLGLSRRLNVIWDSNWLTPEWVKWRGSCIDINYSLFNFSFIFTAIQSYQIITATAGGEDTMGCRSDNLLSRPQRRLQWHIHVKAAVPWPMIPDISVIRRLKDYPANTAEEKTSASTMSARKNWPPWNSPATPAGKWHRMKPGFAIRLRSNSQLFVISFTRFHSLPGTGLYFVVQLPGSLVLPIMP